MKFKFDQYNYNSLFQSAETAKHNKADEFEIEPTPKLESLPKFSRVMPFLYHLLDYEMYFGIWLKNVPFCVLADNSRDHIIFDRNYQGEKMPECKRCFYFKRCVGFPVGYFKKYGKSEVKPIKDLPCEVMIEVEPRCNFECQFCFNKISFAKKGRDIRPFNTAYVKKIIDGIAKAKIKIIRFTGGEPLLRKDIFELMKYAKSKRLEVRLNTNGSLITPAVARKFKGVVDNVLLPIESYQSQKENLITGKTDSLSQKIKAIKLLKKNKIPVVRVGTVALKGNILNLERFAKFIFSLPIDEWELYRPIAAGQTIFNRKDINILVHKLIKIRKMTGRNVFVANALPFCAADDLNKANSVSRGALFDDGHKRMAIDPRGFVKPHYFLNKNIGSPLDILAAWNHPFMKRMRNLGYLPKECASCRFKFKCRGGSRYEAKMTSGSYSNLDPLAQPKNKSKIKKYNLINY